MEDEVLRPGCRCYIEKHADSSVWRVEERAHNVFSLLESDDNLHLEIGHVRYRHC